MLIRRPSGTRKTLILPCFLGHCALRVPNCLSLSLSLSFSLSLSLSCSRNTICTLPTGPRHSARYNRPRNRVATFQIERSKILLATWQNGTTRETTTNIWIFSFETSIQCSSKFVKIRISFGFSRAWYVQSLRSFDKVVNILGNLEALKRLRIFW